MRGYLSARSFVCEALIAAVLGPLRIESKLGKAPMDEQHFVRQA